MEMKQEKFEILKWTKKDIKNRILYFNYF